MPDLNVTSDPMTKLREYPLFQSDTLVMSAKGALIT